jgi:hypothetical protein
MWIKMNEAFKEAISTIFTMLALAVSFIGLPVLAFMVYQKVHKAREKARLASQPDGMQGGPSSPGQAAAILMGLLVILYGAMTGFGLGMISNLINIVFVFPIALGINSGKTIKEAVERAKIRKMWQIVFLSVLSAVAIYGTFHYSRYLGFQVKAAMEIFSSLDEATEEENLQITKVSLDYIFEEETGHSGFLGYVLYEARHGVNIGRLTRSSSFHLGPVLTWLYWLLEFGIILGLTIQMSKSVSNKPVCESCGNPYGSEKHLGGTASANELLMLDLIRQKDFAGLGKLMEPDADLPSLEVYFQGCQVCGKSQSQLVVRHAFQSTKGTLQFKDTSQTILQPVESALLLQQVSPSGD